MAHERLIGGVAIVRFLIVDSLLFWLDMRGGDGLGGGLVRLGRGEVLGEVGKGKGTGLGWEGQNM